MPILSCPPSLIPALSAGSATAGVTEKSAYFGAAAFTLQSTDSQADAEALLSTSSTSADVYINASHVQASSDESAEAIFRLLDHGAAVVFLSADESRRNQVNGLVSSFAEHAVGRVGVVVTSESLESEIEAATANIESTLGLSPDRAASLASTGALPPVWITGVAAETVRAWATSPAGANTLQRRNVLVELPDSDSTPPTALEFAKLGLSVVAPDSKIAIGDAAPDEIDAAGIFLSRTSTDRPDGLITTVVTDERGLALGLVYSSPRSVREMLKTGTGVYESRKRGLWHKGASSGDTQSLVRLVWDCDSDCLNVVVRQHGRGFCHLAQTSCFGPSRGLSRLQQTLESRKQSSPPGSYSARLFSDPKLLQAKIMEEASELAEATERSHVAFEAADLIYFAMARCVAAGVSIEDVERELDRKSAKVSRRKGDAKVEWEKVVEAKAAPVPEVVVKKDDQPKQPDRIEMQKLVVGNADAAAIATALERPSQRSSDSIMSIVKPIIDAVRTRGDAAVLEYTHKFEKAVSLTSPVITAPFSPDLMVLPAETVEAIDISFENIRKFHTAQADNPAMLTVETMEGVLCHRFARPIESVGLYVPGGSAVLPSTALMLGVPAMVAGCKTIVIASPPRSDGSISPEIVYVAQKVGATAIVLAGGAQAVASLAYGTESIPKVDKILGPGNQFVTAAKMVVSNDTSAGVAIDMPAGPSEVLVIANETSVPAFVASDLLSQAEHGPDSQVVLIAAGVSDQKLAEIDDELDRQARALPRVDIVRQSIAHSSTLVVDSVPAALELSNRYAPEHLILHLDDAADHLPSIENAGSVFVGHWTPESVGDYSAGVNHSLPTYGYAKQYSGVSLASFVKHITASQLSPQGLRNIGKTVMTLAKVEELEAHRRAVEIRLESMRC